MREGYLINQESLTREIVELCKSLPVMARVEIVEMLNGLRLVSQIYVRNEKKKEYTNTIEQLQKQGLVVDQKETEKLIIYFVSKDGGLAKEAVDLCATGVIQDHRRFGELMGFPVSSIDAYVEGLDNFLTDDEVEEMVGFKNRFVNMRLSKDNREESKKYLRDVYRVLLEQLPDIFEEDEKKKVVDFVFRS